MSGPLILDGDWAFPALPDDTGEVHVYCCRPDRALCGDRLTGEDLGYSDGSVDCLRCDVIEEADVPCGAPFCRLRSRLRVWRRRLSS